jgi:hypothetical protein
MASARMNTNTLAHSSYMSADLGGNNGLNISLDNVIKPGLRALVSPKHSIQPDYPNYTLESIDNGRTSRTAAHQKRGSPIRNDMTVYEMISNGMKNQFNLTKPKFSGIKGYMIPDANEVNFRTRNIAQNKLDKKDHFTE